MAKKKTIVVARPQPKKTKKNKQDKELTRLGWALRGLGGLGGAAVGGLIGMPNGGASVGTGLGAALSKWLGSGDYEVKSNSLVKKASTGIPMMHKNDQKIIVRHKEFVCEVKSSQDFTIQRTLEINPGLENTFPWLSRIAGVYQTYRITGMVYHYVPTSGSAVSSTNNALGSVMLQTSYRATSAPPGSKTELLNEYWACESMPSETFCHPIECAPSENPFQVQYIRRGEVPEGDNRMLYDLGKTFVATSGMQQSGVVLGDLWVTYEIELTKPVVSDNVNDRVDFDGYIHSSATTANYFGNGTIELGEHKVRVEGSRDLFFPVGLTGEFIVTVNFYGTGAFTCAANPGLVDLDLKQIYPGSITRIDANRTAASGADESNVVMYRVVKTKRDREGKFTITSPTSTLIEPFRVEIYITRA